MFRLDPETRTIPLFLYAEKENINREQLTTLLQFDLSLYRSESCKATPHFGQVNHPATLKAHRNLQYLFAESQKHAHGSKNTRQDPRARVALALKTLSVLQVRRFPQFGPRVRTIVAYKLLHFILPNKAPFTKCHSLRVSFGFPSLPSIDQVRQKRHATVFSATRL